MAFICDVCGKNFAERKQLTRHRKTHNEATHNCSVCGKGFKDRSNLKRHEKTHGDRPKYACPYCDHQMERLDNFKAHMTNHENQMTRTRTRSRSPVRRPSSPALPSSPQPGTSRARPSSPVRRPSSTVSPPDVLPTDPETRTLYLRHWEDIRNRENTGNRVQDRYNFTLHGLAPDIFQDMVHQIFRQQTTSFLINLSFGFILRNTETGDLRYFHSSFNNHRFFEKPHLIQNEEDLEKFLEELIRQDIFEFIRQQRDNTKWVVHLLTNITFFINKLSSHPIGGAVVLPPYVTNNQGLNNMVGGSHGGYMDNLCFFRCLAVYQGATVVNVETKAKDLFYQYLRHFQLTSTQFKGIYLQDLHLVEQLFKLNVMVYELKEENDKVHALLVRRTPYKFETTMNLNVSMNHFSYIKNMDKYSKSYQCRQCGRLWKHAGMLHRHERTCKGETRFQHQGGVYHTKKTVFEELADEGVNVHPQLRFFPYRATYDIETMFNPTNKTNTEKLIWINQHALLSISICSNVPGYTKPRCFVIGDDPDVIATAVDYLERISEAAYHHTRNKLAHIFERIDDMLDTEFNDCTAEEKENQKKGHYLHRLSQRLDSHLKELPVIGFNSGRYDLNAMKIEFFSYLARRNLIKFVVKRNNNFMCVKTEKLKFLDIMNYLAPEFSYAKFLKAYDCTEEKGFFPYEWMDSLEKLDHTQLPSHDAFFSTLKNNNITEEEYQFCQSVFKEKKMTTMKDFLVWYNNKDVEPMLEAIDKMFKFYTDRNIDMFKDGISVPGLTLKYMFQGIDDYFTLTDEKHKEVYHLLKENIVGGPSIVFHRHHEKDVTTIRPQEYENPKPCKQIVGYDANALYLWSIMQDMPTGHFSIRKAEDDFKRITPRRFENLAMTWLQWQSLQTGRFIRHQGNNTEKLIGIDCMPVDGYCAETRTVYEFQGCIWHGHQCRLTQKFNGVNPVNNVSCADLFEKAKIKKEKIIELGYNYEEIWECDWYNEINRNKELKRFTNSLKRPCDWYTTMTEEQILNAVTTNKLFGALELDIQVPDHLKSTFSEMPPIFKNTDISRDDIGDHMKNYAFQQNIMSQPRKSLIGSMFGQKIMIITPLLKWYLAHGLVVTKIYTVLEYTPSKTFDFFGDVISNARRAGDVDPSKTIIADTMKLTGNSSYGKTVTSKEKHTAMKYCQENEVEQFLMDPHFRKCSQLEDDTFEIEMSKQVIKLDLPIQIGCFVYQYAKLRMLQFYFDLIDKYVDRRDYQYCCMDTDSAYMALSAETLDEVIKPEMKQQFVNEKHLWFPRDDTPEHAAYDKRTPGLFKEEFKGDGIIALCNKTYYCFGHDNKYSCKGVNKKLNNITKETYMDVLLTKKSGSGTNRGFRSVDNMMHTYLQERAGFSYFYPKRKVLDDGISTVPLDI